MAGFPTNGGRAKPVRGLYDLDNDVAEKHNLLTRKPHLAEQLLALHTQRLTDVGRPPPVTATQ